MEDFTYEGVTFTQAERDLAQARPSELGKGLPAFPGWEPIPPQEANHETDLMWHVSSTFDVKDWYHHRWQEYREWRDALGARLRPRPGYEIAKGDLPFPSVSTVVVWRPTRLVSIHHWEEHEKQTDEWGLPLKGKSK